jgi:phosphoketolase
VAESQAEAAERIADLAAAFRAANPALAKWAAGRGAIEHTPLTQIRVHRMAEELAARNIKGDGVPIYELLSAADRIANTAMWLVVHETYARRVCLDGRALGAEDFKPDPQGHTGGALNMVPAYAGYMAINALTGITRAWLMGQGHTVAAIDSVNLLLGNVERSFIERYPLTDEGLTRYVCDFYSYRLSEHGEPDSPLGSHVNPHTAGGIMEGGYLGFAELQYVHMPLPGERLVVFLSDGAFEEQRGSDWAPRWWRQRDSGLVAPIMINNGRRIDQRTTMSQEGGIEWFRRHLELNSFDPIVFDGRDPAAFAWAIFELESRLVAAARAAEEGGERYPVRLPYGIAVARKGAGFYGAGTNLAHNLPLGANPHTDATAAGNFNASARDLWVPMEELARAVDLMRHHKQSGRKPEREHPLAWRDVRLSNSPEPQLALVGERSFAGGPASGTTAGMLSPMQAIDEGFLAAVCANPHLRPRVGNPDEMKSNRMTATLQALRFRVTDPEPGVPEAIDGGVITALNEEAVVSAALANKGGINIVVTYEAFASKMLGAIRQEIIFALASREAGKPARWLSMPLLLTSHVYENGKNELSHQDPTMAEALMGEMADVSRVIFPADYNSAAVAIAAAYRTQGQIWTMVVRKKEMPVLLEPAECRALMADGAIELEWAGFRREKPRAIVTAVGAYQLIEALKASRRLAEREVPHRVVYIVEPGRFRIARNAGEQSHLAPAEVSARLYPDDVMVRVFLCHTREAAILGALRPLDTGPRHTVALGFINRGGTLDVDGMLFVNRQTWAHCVDAVCGLIGVPRAELLSEPELEALDHRRSPHGVLFA